MRLFLNFIFYLLSYVFILNNSIYSEVNTPNNLILNSIANDLQISDSYTEYTNISIINLFYNKFINNTINTIDSYTINHKDIFSVNNYLIYSSNNLFDIQYQTQDSDNTDLLSISDLIFSLGLYNQNKYILADQNYKKPSYHINNIIKNNTDTDNSEEDDNKTKKNLNFEPSIAKSDVNNNIELDKSLANLSITLKDQKNKDNYLTYSKVVIRYNSLNKTETYKTNTSLRNKERFLLLHIKENERFELKIVKYRKIANKWFKKPFIYNIYCSFKYGIASNKKLQINIIYNNSRFKEWNKNSIVEFDYTNI